MKHGGLCTFGALALLLTVAGCGGGFLNYAERPAWRHQAEVNCLKSGGVKIASGVEQMSPIAGPGHLRRRFPAEGIRAGR